MIKGGWVSRCTRVQPSGVSSPVARARRKESGCTVMEPPVMPCLSSCESGSSCLNPSVATPPPQCGKARHACLPKFPDLGRDGMGQGGFGQLVIRLAVSKPHYPKHNSLPFRSRNRTRHSNRKKSASGCHFLEQRRTCPARRDAYIGLRVSKRSIVRNRDLASQQASKATGLGSYNREPLGCGIRYQPIVPGPPLNGPAYFDVIQPP
jgi:hypothetical protein